MNIISDIVSMISLILLLNNVNCKRDGEIVNNVEPRTIKREIYIILSRTFFYLEKFLPSWRGIKKGRWEQLEPFSRYIYIYI